MKGFYLTDARNGDVDFLKLPLGAQESGKSAVLYVCGSLVLEN